MGKQVNVIVYTRELADGEELQLEDLDSIKRLKIRKMSINVDNPNWTMRLDRTLRGVINLLPNSDRELTINDMFNLEASSDDYYQLDDPTISITNNSGVSSRITIFFDVIRE